MTDQEINVAIADECGVLVCGECGGDGRETCNNPDHGLIDAVGGEIGRLGCPVCGHSSDHKTEYKCGKCNGTGRLDVPDYCHDLNAMHEVEALKASDMLWCQNYQEHLRFTCDTQGFDWETCFIWHATARQRATAFLKTIGGWKE